jgi:exodeoxyribonuclease VII small subunit
MSKTKSTETDTPTNNPSSEPTNKGDAEIAFETALERLEDSVGRLESGDLSLEEALAAFESGIAASRICANRLDQTRKKVQVLVEQEGGNFGLDFLDNDDEEI